MELEVIQISEKNQKWFQRFLSEREWCIWRRNPFAFALGAVMDSMACGVLLCETPEDTSRLINLNVSFAARRQGVATSLVENWENICSGKGIMLDASFYAFEDEESCLAFWRSLPGWHLSEKGVIRYNIPVSGLKEVNIPETRGNGMPFFGLPELRVRQFIETLRKEGIHLLDGFAADKASMLKDACICSMADGVVHSCVLIREISKGTDFSVYFAYCDRWGMHSLLDDFKKGIAYLLENYPDGNLYMTCINEQSKKLADYLLPDSKIAGVGMQAWKFAVSRTV